MRHLAEKRARYRQRHREQGLCLCCARKAVPGKIRCQRCLDVIRKEVREARQEALQEGRCLICYQPLHPEEIKAGQRYHSRSNCIESRRGKWGG